MAKNTKFKNISLPVKITMFVLILIAILIPTLRYFSSSSNVTQVTSVDQLEEYYTTNSLLNLKAYKIEPPTYEYIGDLAYQERITRGRRKKVRTTETYIKKVYRFQIGDDYVYTLRSKSSEPITTLEEDECYLLNVNKVSDYEVISSPKSLENSDYIVFTDNPLDRLIFDVLVNLAIVIFGFFAIKFIVDMFGIAIGHFRKK